MNNTLIVLLGDYGSGKTTFAKDYAGWYEAVYLDVDLLAQTNGQFNYPVFLNRVQALMGTRRQTTFILDGAPDTIAMTDTLGKDLGCQIKYWVCFASPLDIQSRQGKKQQRFIQSDLPHSIDEIVRITFYQAVLATAKDPRTQFIDTSSKEHYDHLNYRQWLSCWHGHIFLSKRKRDYQDIEIPYHRQIGHSESYKTWERLQLLVDFTGKSVIDYGTNYGYFLFKAEEAGASVLNGVDVSSSVIQTARSVAILRGSKATFHIADLNDYIPGEHYDVALCLNTLHHVVDKTKVLGYVFNSAEDVLVESAFDHLDEIEGVAKQFGHRQIDLLNSHRYQRIILHYSTNKIEPITVPAKYAYSWKHYQKQRVYKAVFHVIGSKRLTGIVHMGGKVLRKLGLFEVMFGRER